MKEIKDFNSNDTLNFDDVEINVECIRNRFCKHKCASGLCYDLEIWDC